eukprot:g6496.t1
MTMKAKGESSDVLLIKTDLRQLLLDSANKYLSLHSTDNDELATSESIYSSAFIEFDTDKTGKITKSEFSECLSTKLGTVLSPASLEILIACFDIDGDGLIDYTEFSKFATRSLEKSEVEILADTLREWIVEEGLEADLRDSFKEFDVDSNGTISHAELERTLTRMRFPSLNAHELYLLIEHFDRDGDGQISYAEFVAFLLPSPDVDRIERRFGALVRALRRTQSIELLDVFRKKDTWRTGYLSDKDFFQMLDGYGLPLEHKEVMGLLQRYDLHGTGQIDYMELLKHAELQHSVTAQSNENGKKLETLTADKVDSVSAQSNVNGKKLETLTADEVASLLLSLGAPTRLVELLKSESIDGEMLELLSKEDAEDLGIETATDDAKALFVCIERAKAATPPPPSPPPPLRHSRAWRTSTRFVSSR